MSPETNQGWFMGADMPHEKLMDKKGLEFKTLSKPIQDEIRKFDIAYSRALSDGDISNEEYNSLLDMSQSIVELIEADQKKDQDSEKDQDQSDDDNTGTGIVIGLFAGILGAFGLSKLLNQ
jgi:hypothetical protein